MVFDPQIFLAAAEAVEHAAGAAAEHPEEAGFIGTLGINWKLFLAQLLNFGVVLFVLWKWVMKPVVGALEARRTKIEGSLKKAQELEERITEFEQQREQDMRKARAEAQEIMSRGVAAGEVAKAEAVSAARAEAERILKENESTIASEKLSMMRELREEVAGLTIMAVEKILREKVDTRKDQELIKEALKNLK